MGMGERSLLSFQKEASDADISRVLRTNRLAPEGLIGRANAWLQAQVREEAAGDSPTPLQLLGRLASDPQIEFVEPNAVVALLDHISQPRIVGPFLHEIQVIDGPEP